MARLTAVTHSPPLLPGSYCLSSIHRRFLNGVKQRHQWFSERLSAINAKYGLFKEIRGLGLLIGCVLNDEYAGKAKAISTRAAEDGLMVMIAGANVVRFAPALNVSEEEVNTGLDRF